jgi:hypothetical protein
MASQLGRRLELMAIAMEKILAWKIMPRLMMLVMTIMYIRVIEWFMSLPQDIVSTQATALTATVTGALTGAFAVWVGHEK